MKKGLNKPFFLGWAFLVCLVLPYLAYGAESNCTTVPNMRFEKTVGLGGECGTDSYLIVEPGTEVTYCLTLENPANGGTLWAWYVVTDAPSGLRWPAVGSQTAASPQMGYPEVPQPGDPPVQFKWTRTINVTGTIDNTANVRIGTFEVPPPGEDECIVTEEDRARVFSRTTPNGGGGSTEQVPGMTTTGLLAGGILLIVAAVLFIRRRRVSEH